MTARRSPLAVLVHVLSVLALCAVGHVLPASSGGSSAPALTRAPATSSVTSALRPDRVVDGVRAARGAIGGDGGGPDAAPPAVLPAAVVVVPPATSTRLAGRFPSDTLLAFVTPRAPTARGPPSRA